MNFLIQFSPFFDYKYLFDQRPVPLGPSLVGSIFVFFSWFVILTLVMAVFAFMVKKHDRLRAKIFERLARVFALAGFGGLALLFFTYEQIPIFQMRFWVVILFILVIAQLINITLYIVRDYPKEKARIAEQERLAKYTPGKK